MHSLRRHFNGCTCASSESIGHDASIPHGSAGRTVSTSPPRHTADRGSTNGALVRRLDQLGRPRSTYRRASAPRVHPAMSAMNQVGTESCAPGSRNLVARGPPKNAAARPIIAHPDPTNPRSPATAMPRRTFVRTIGNVSCCNPKKSATAVVDAIKTMLPTTPAPLSGRYTRTRLLNSPPHHVTHLVVDDSSSSANTGTDRCAALKDPCLSPSPVAPLPSLRLSTGNLSQHPPSACGPRSRPSPRLIGTP